MNPSALANAFTLAGTLLGVPSLTVLLLYAINEIRNGISPASISSELAANPDAVTTALNLLTATLGHHLIIAATSGLILAGLCWIIGRGFQFRTSSGTVSHPGLTVSIRG